MLHKPCSHDGQHTTNGHIVDYFPGAAGEDAGFVKSAFLMRRPTRCIFGPARRTLERLWPKELLWHAVCLVQLSGHCWDLTSQIAQTLLHKDSRLITCNPLTFKQMLAGWAPIMGRCLVCSAALSHALCLQCCVLRWCMQC